jgi:Short C-terminal domain
VAKDAASQKLLDALVSTSPPVWAGNALAREMVYGHLAKLAELRDRGVLSDEEFAAQKAKILGTS